MSRPRIGRRFWLASRATSSSIWPEWRRCKPCPASPTRGCAGEYSGERPDVTPAQPRLLFVSPRFLFPMDQGGKIRTGNILRGLKGGAFEVSLASPAPADVTRFAPDLDAACDRFVSWPERAPTRTRRVLALGSAVPVAVATDRSNE